MLTVIAWLSLSVAAACFLLIALDERKHPQKMPVMNIVWPVTALYFSVFALWAYYRIGRRMERDRHAAEMVSDDARKSPVERKPRWSAVAVSASHCGAGCVLADILCESAVYLLALTLWGQSLYASYLLDLAGAWLFGIAFQYFAIKPMKHLSAGAALKAAIKADTLSIVAFQAGMYAWMAVVYFVLWPQPHLAPNQPGFWLMMQIAMVFGFFTTLPMNYWLIKIGVKESMG